MARLAYLFSTFPALTTTFMQHQVAATERLGLDPFLAAARRPGPGGCHPGDEVYLGRTFYLTPVRPLAYLDANLAALIASPGRYREAAWLALTLNDDFPFQRVRNLAHLAGAAVLARRFKAAGVGHVHVHFAFGAASVAMYLQKLAGLPYSLTVHGSDVLLKRPLTEEKLSRAKFVVSNCHFHAANLRTRYPALTEQRFYIVRGGIDTAAGPYSRPAPPPEPGPLRILSVGRLVEVKAQDVLIRALGLMRDRGLEFVCRIVGDGPERDKLDRLIGELELADRVELTGPLFQDDIVAQYDWCHVVALSSKSEGTPMTIIEAMAKGRPAVAPSITAIPEMIIDGQTGFLTEPGSAEDLAAKLARLAENRNLIADLGRAGRKRAEEYYDLTANARQLLAVFAKEAPSLGLEVEAEVEYV